MKPYRINPNSKNNTQNRLLQERYGEFWNDGNPWTNEEDNQLLEGWLILNWPYTSTNKKPSFQSEMGRNSEGIETRLTKLVNGYSGGDNYQPINRTDRSGTPFNRRDDRLIAMMANRKDDKPIDYQRLAMILARTAKEIKQHLSGVATIQRTGFFS